MNLDHIRQAYLRGLNQWTGCDWATQFGGRKLNLDCLRSSQAAMVAECLWGDEAADWQHAVRWLARVETDARLAEREAASAIFLAIFDHLPEAFEHVERACALESQYHEKLVWEPLRQAIAAALHKPNSGENVTQLALAAR